jgi:amino acid transporter
VPSVYLGFLLLSLIRNEIIGYLILLPVIVIQIFYWYILSCLIIWIYNKRKTKNKKTKVVQKIDKKMSVLLLIGFIIIGSCVYKVYLESSDLYKSKDEIFPRPLDAYVTMCNNVRGSSYASKFDFSRCSSAENIRNMYFLGMGIGIILIIVGLIKLRLPWD